MNTVTWKRDASYENWQIWVNDKFDHMADMVERQLIDRLDSINVLVTQTFCGYISTGISDAIQAAVVGQ